MNARIARQRQQLIENTLAGLEAILCKDKTLLQELDPEQEQRLKILVGIATHKGYCDL